MKTIQTFQQAEGDGKLRLEIPVEKPGHTYEVVVVVSDESENVASQSNGWPDGYMESVIGKWEGDFDVQPEGSFEQREPL